MPQTLQIHLPPIICHRGGCAYAPENTLVALDIANKHHATFIETDIALTADQQVICLHDDTVDRTTDGQGAIHQLSLADVQRLDAGTWFDPHFREEKIPTLEAMLQRTKVLNFGINIELKPSGTLASVLVEHCLRVVEKVWNADLCPVLFSSSCVNTLAELRKQAPEAYLALLFEQWAPSWEQQADKLEVVTIHLNHQCLNGKRIAEIKTTGRKVLAYTVNAYQQAKDLFDMGVDSLFSDYPDLMQGSSTSKGMRYDHD